MALRDRTTLLDFVCQFSSSARSPRRDFRCDHATDPVFPAVPCRTWLSIVTNSSFGFLTGLIDFSFRALVSFFVELHRSNLHRICTAYQQPQQRCSNSFKARRSH